MRILGIVLASALGLGVALVLVAVVSARLALDAERSHSRRVANLPVLGNLRVDGEARIPARDMQFRARVSGLRNRGEGVLLLHGFPETSASYEPLLPALADAGFRAVAFDQRGYSPGARPREVSAYSVSEIAADALAVADAMGFERFHLVGHDWGAVVGWALASDHPERVISWTALSISHPQAIAAEAGGSPPSYIRLFRMPGVVETLFRINGMALMKNSLYAEMPEPMRDEYLSVFAEEGSLRAALSWYRALDPAVGFQAGEVEPPVLYVFGNQDFPAFTSAAVRAHHADWVRGPYREVELDAGHWLLQEAPDRVVAEVLAHVQEPR